MSLVDLQEQVTSDYARLDLPSWPDPHPAGASPRDEEYSRLSDPARYRIVHERARLWAKRLVDVPGVTMEELTPVPVDENRLGGFDRGVRLSSRRAGTLPLLLLERGAPAPGLDTTLAILHISVAEPGIVVEVQPDCGCDACDSGSPDLLSAIDDAVSHIVGGPFVLLCAEGWCAQWHPEGGSSGGSRLAVGHARAMELCRRLAVGEGVRLPKGCAAFVGGSWVD